MKVIEDGSVLSLSDILGSDLRNSKGQTVTFSQVGSTNTYTCTVTLPDGKTEKWYWDKPEGSAPVVRRVS